MQSRRQIIITIALGSALLNGCQQQAPSPTELDTVRTSSDTYLAYARGDCATVRRLADPQQLRTWAFNEMRHSMLLLQGFCREIDGDLDGAHAIYRQLILEAPRSFASDDAAERTRVLKLIENNPGYLERINTARDRVDPQKPRRTPVDRVPVEFPPLAKATGIDGYAVIEFGITRRGETANSVVVESNPPLLFDGAALRAVRRWQYMRKPSTSTEDRQLIRILFRQDGSTDSVNEDSSGAPAIQ